MKRHPSHGEADVDQHVKQRPVGDHVGTVYYSFSFEVWRSYRSVIEMLAPDCGSGR